MAATGFTPIQLYRTTTALAQPSAGNLADGELAINTTDKKLYAKDSGGAVFLLADASSGSTTATNLAGGAAGSLPYQSGANATVFRAIGTAGQVLQVNSGATAPEWVSSSGTGNVARVNSPSFTTPSLGAATALSINSLTITTSTGTFTLANGKTLTVNNSLTLSGTDATTMTFPSTNATIARTDAGQTFTGTQTVRAAATQDAVALAGRAGGTSSYVSTLTPTTLSASRTITLPDANTVIPVATQVLTFAGPTSARTITLPDANFTAARTDAAQTFTGVQTFGSNPIFNAGNANGLLYLNASKAATSSSTISSDGTNLQLGAQGDMRFADADSSNWVAFQAPSVVASNITWTLPSADGTADQALATDGLGTLSWVSFATFADIGTAPNQLPLNQYLGTMAFQDADAVSVGFIRSNATTGSGYALGAGSTVTQATSRTTGVTINAACGAITLVSAAGTTTPASFTVTNSSVAATDVIILSQKSGTDKQVLLVTAVAAGSFEITAYTTGGTTTEQPVINFAVIKAVTA